MGMYTQLNFHVELEDAPQEVIDVLSWMDTNEGRQPATPEHPLFRRSRWMMLLGGSSYYFNPTESLSRFWHDDISRSWHLSVLSSIKNYEGEIGQFLEWIMPYVKAEPGEFLGYHRYEEDDQPTLIYAPGGTR